MNVRTIRRSAGCMLGSLAVIAWGFCCGRPAAAEAVSPVLIVSLLQQSTGIATSGSQTNVLAALQVSGSSPVPISTAGFSTVLTWSTTSAGVFNTNLYTVNSVGTGTIGSAALRVNEPGFLFFDSSPISSMNVTNIDLNSQRYVAVDAEPVTLPAGTFGPITIMEVRFGVSPGINRALFDFALDTNPENYGFSNADFTQTYAFTNGGGSILITPEPDTMTGLLVGGLGCGGWGLVLRRRGSRRRPHVAMA